MNFSSRSTVATRDHVIDILQQNDNVTVKIIDKTPGLCSLNYHWEKLNLFQIKITRYLGSSRYNCVYINAIFDLASGVVTSIVEFVEKARLGWSRPVVSPQPLFDRDSSLFVARGLYVLRYESCGGHFDHPTAVVGPGPGSEADIEIISAPGCPSGRLEQPGTALLVRAANNGRLQIGVKRKGSTGSLDAAFKLESVGGLSLGLKQDTNSQRLRAEDERTPLSPIKAAESAGASSDALFVAHIARRGDVRVMPGEWAAGPDTPAGIEGLEIRSLGEEGVLAELQVAAGSRDPKWSDWSGAGVFAGSRGQNRPLVGLRLRLVGEQAHRFIVNADALFLGSAIMNKRGREIECVSQAGRDPLVGFRFEICPERRLSIRPSVTLPAGDAGARVRVFRAAAAA